jgi:hypothetical protein
MMPKAKVLTAEEKKLLADHAAAAKQQEKDAAIVRSEQDRIDALIRQQKFNAAVYLTAKDWALRLKRDAAHLQALLDDGVCAEELLDAFEYLGVPFDEQLSKDAD